MESGPDRLPVAVHRGFLSTLARSVWQDPRPALAAGSGELAGIIQLGIVQLARPAATSCCWSRADRFDAFVIYAPRRRTC